MPATAHLLWSVEVLPFEMWLAVQGQPLDMAVRGRSTRSTVWRGLARHLRLRVRRWIWQFDVAVDDCRVGFDFLAARGVAPETIWTPTGPSPTLRLFSALEFTLPANLVGHAEHIDPLLALYAALRRPTPRIFPRSRCAYVWRVGRHDLLTWLQARGSVGARLLALRSVGARADFDPDPAFLASLDMRLRRIARLGAFTTGPAPTNAQRVDWADTLRDGQMLACLSAWLNDAERRQSAGKTIDFSLPRLLGLSETTHLRIIP